MWIQTFLLRLKSLARDFVRRHREVTIFEYDANYLFNRVLDKSAEFPETSHYRNTTMFCDAYESKSKLGRHVVLRVGLMSIVVVPWR